MAYSRDEAFETHKDYKENVNLWEYYIRSYNGGYDYTLGQFLNRYNLELDNEYNQRLGNTPCDNHCKNIIQIYSSFLFRVKASRDFGAMADEASLESFIKDADLDGNSFDAVMKQAQNYSSIYGHCFLILDKPNITTNTRAEELEQDIRPYLSIVTPENVTNWKYERLANGKYDLTEVVVREDISNDKFKFRDTKKMFVADHVSRFYEKHKDRMNLVPVFGIEVDSKDVTLSDEHIDYKWLDFEEAFDTLIWNGQKQGLKTVYNMLLKNDDRIRWTTIELKKEK